MASLRRPATALASASLKSKSPPTHSPLWQTKQNIDFAWWTFTLYFISLFLFTPSESKYARFTVRPFSRGNFSARLTDSWTSWLWRRRYSARGLVLRGGIIVQSGGKMRRCHSLQMGYIVGT